MYEHLLPKNGQELREFLVKLLTRNQEVKDALKSASAGEAWNALKEESIQAQFVFDVVTECLEGVDADHVIGSRQFCPACRQISNKLGVDFGCAAKVHKTL